MRTSNGTVFSDPSAKRIVADRAAVLSDAVAGAGIADIAEGAEEAYDAAAEAVKEATE